MRTRNACSALLAALCVLTTAQAAPAATLDVTPDTGLNPAGDTLNVSGSGWTPERKVNVSLCIQGDPRLASDSCYNAINPAADTNGDFSAAYAAAFQQPDGSLCRAPYCKLRAHVGSQMVYHDVVFATGSADLTLTQSDTPDPVNTGASVTYTLTIHNNGPDDATDVIVNDALPTGTVLTAATGCDTGGIPGLPDPADCRVGLVPSGSSVIVTFTVTAPATPTTLNNTATATARENEAGSSSDNAFITENTTVQNAPVNHQPYCFGGSIDVDEDSDVEMSLNCTDEDGDALAYTISGGPAHGNISGTLPHVVYAPDADYNGPDSFSFMASDGQLDSTTDTINITVGPLNDAPTCADTTATTDEDTAVGVSLDCQDVDGDPLTYSVVSDPSHGSLSGSGASRTYTPAAGYSGSDAFTFRADDGQANSGPATASITVTPVNHAPVANPDSWTIRPGEILDLAAPGVMGNDADADGDLLTAHVVSISFASGEWSGLSADGSFTYSAAPGTSTVQSKTITYYVTDSKGAASNTTTAVVTIDLCNGSSTATYCIAVRNTPGILGYYRMNTPTPGSAAADALGRYPGEYSLNTSSAPSPFNFTGEADAAVRLGSISGTKVYFKQSGAPAGNPTYVFNGNQAFSVELWFYNTYTYNFWVPIIGAGTSGGANGWIIQSLRKGTTANFTRMGQSASTSVMPSSGWVHLVGTYDGVSTIKLYVNGVLRGTNTSSSGSINPGSTYRAQTSDPNGATPCFCDMDEVSFYSRELSAGEVSAHYAAR